MKPTQELKVIAQIIQELALFLMYHGYKHYHISFDDQGDVERFIVMLPNMNTELISKMKKQIDQPREESIEAYYFELLGDLDSKEDLELLGIFIDHMEVIESEQQVKLIFTRKK
jgi:hypothetical protein